MRMRCVTRVVPSGPGASSWSATVVTPPLRAVHVKLWAGSHWSTTQCDAGNRGCFTVARLPTASGELSGFTDVIDAVQSGQRSTSASTSQTCSGDAAIVVVTSYSMVRMYHLVHVAP